MKHTLFLKTRIGVALYVGIIVSVAVNLSNPWLAAGAVVSGVLFLWLLKRSLHIRTSDERTSAISGKAATMTYAITSTSLAILSLLFIFGFPQIPYLKSLGTIFSYITLTMIALYSILYKLYDARS